MDDPERKETLQSQGFPAGLAAELLQYASSHPVRIWLVDNRGTMHKNDGHMVSQSTKGDISVIPCTRWHEVTSTIQWHAEFAAWCQTPMAVRLLQDPGVQVGPQQVGVAASKRLSCKEEVQRLKSLLHKTRPDGATSRIHWHLLEVIPSIETLLPILEQTDKGLVLCVCTDSIPTDGQGKEDATMLEDFLSTLHQLAEWPVQIIWRLSTDEERVVQYYQNIAICKGGSLRSSILVLDDYISECRTVQQHNPWFHYGYPLHLCREEGISLPVLEMLRQRPLTSDELCCLIGFLFGVNFPSTLYGPERDYAQFRRYVKNLNQKAGVLWNPLPRKFVLWIHMKELDRMYDPRRGLRKLFGSRNGRLSLTKAKIIEK